MTQEELDAVITEIIIPQEKPKSTGNSHKRKQWENRKYWRECTVGESCKVGVIKSCKEPLDCDSLRCDKCYGQWGLSARRRAYGRGTVGTEDCKSHYKRIYFGLKDLRTFYNRQLRRCYKGEIGNYGYYRKMFEIWYLM